MYENTLSWSNVRYFLKILKGWAKEIALNSRKNQFLPQDLLDISHVTTVVAFFLSHQCQCVSKFIALKVHNLLSFQHFHGVHINIFAQNSIGT